MGMPSALTEVLLTVTVLLVVPFTINLSPEPAFVNINPPDRVKLPPEAKSTTKVVVSPSISKEVVADSGCSRITLLALVLVSRLRISNSCPTRAP